MRTVLTVLIAFSFLCCNRVVEKEPIQANDSTSNNEEELKGYKDTLKPVKLEKGQSLVLDSAQLSHLSMYYNYDEQHRIIPELKMYATYSPYAHSTYQAEYLRFYLQDNSYYSFSDTLIISGHAESEQGSSIFTVWKKEGDKFRYISDLDKDLIMYAKVDSVFNLGKNKYLLAGLSGWGDAGEGAGSIWFAVWELPGSFRMIYYDKWFSPFTERDGDEDKEYSYNYSVKDNRISVEKLYVSIKHNSNTETRIHNKWEVSKNTIPIDLKSKIDMTSKYNRGGE